MTSLILLILKSLVCHNAPLIPTGSSLGHYEFCVFNFADIFSLTQQTQAHSAPAQLALVSFSRQSES